VALARHGSELRLVDHSIHGVARVQWCATLRALARSAGCSEIAGWLHDPWSLEAFQSEERHDCIPMIAMLSGAALRQADFAEIDRAP
jgi:hypothetical protein